MTMEAWSLDGIEQEVLSVSQRGDGGQRVVKIRYNGAPLILKFYGLKRGRLHTLARGLLERVAGVKSSFDALDRRETERAVLDLWRKEGFAVPRLLYPDFLDRIPQPCLAMEWIAGETLAAVLRGTEILPARKHELVAELARAMGARHARALTLHDCRLIPEHPALQHILVSDDRLVNFDFETVFTARVDIERVVRYEIGNVLTLLAKHCKEDFSLLGRLFVTTYPDRMRLKQAVDDLQEFGTIPIKDWLAKFPIAFRLSKRYRKKAHDARFLANLLTQGKSGH